MNEALPDFAGKVVLVGFRGTAERSYGYLKSPTFVTHHGRLFLVGEELGSSLTTGIPWDAVMYYTIGNSVADFKEANRARSPDGKNDE